MNEQLTSNRQPLAEPAFAAFIAIDWADKKHYYSVQAAESSKIESGALDNTPEAVEAWAVGLNQRFGDRPLAVALEQRKGALVVLLSKYPHLHLYPVHPLTLARYREMWNCSGAKSDPEDAELLLDLLTKHRDRLRGLDPETDSMRRLQALVENRRKLVDEKTTLNNKAKDLLKVYFPQILTWFDDITTELVEDLLLRWPTLQDLKRARPATLERFLLEHRSRDLERNQQRIEQVQKAIPATDDLAVIDAARPMIQAWMEQIAALRKWIRAVEDQIESAAPQELDWFIFDSLPGAGKVMAPRLMAALGTRRERFESASNLQCLAGIAPVKEASGNTKRVHMRWACPKFLRQTFHEWAACTISRSVWARAYYDQQRAAKKSHHTAVRALAFKWMRIVHRCWVSRQPYREEIYLASLAKRNPEMYQRALAAGA